MSKSLEELAIELRAGEEDLQKQFMVFQVRLSELLPQQGWEDNSYPLPGGYFMACTNEILVPTWNGREVVGTDIDELKKFVFQLPRFLMCLSSQFSQMIGTMKQAEQTLASI